jgi:uncharacterized OB-fold protein
VTDSILGRFTPLPNEFTQPYWDAAKRRVLVMQKCTVCDSYVWYPREFCPECSSGELEWVEVSGKGRVYSFTLMRQAPFRELDHLVPFILGVVQTAEGMRMYTNVTCPVEEIYIGMPVRARFEDLNDEITLVKWEPDPDASGSHNRPSTVGTARSQ